MREDWKAIPTCGDCGQWPIYCECEQQGKAVADFVEAALQIGIWKLSST